MDTLFELQYKAVAEFKWSFFPVYKQLSIVSIM